MSGTGALALSVGVLPAAIIGLAPRRRGRLLVIVLGVLTGVPMLVGGLLAGGPGPRRRRSGRPRRRRGAACRQVAMVLSLPMVGVGLSYVEVGKPPASPP